MVVRFDLNFMFCRPGMQTAHNLALSSKTWHRMICILTIPDYLRDLAGGSQEPDWTGVISNNIEDDCLLQTIVSGDCGERGENYMTTMKYECDIVI